jgi:hypothetical protein
LDKTNSSNNNSIYLNKKNLPKLERLSVFTIVWGNYILKVITGLTE